MSTRCLQIRKQWRCQVTTVAHAFTLKWAFEMSQCTRWQTDAIEQSSKKSANYSWKWGIKSVICSKRISVRVASFVYTQQRRQMSTINTSSKRSQSILYCISVCFHLNTFLTLLIITHTVEVWGRQTTSVKAGFHHLGSNWSSKFRKLVVMRSRLLLVHRKLVIVNNRWLKWSLKGLVRRIGHLISSQLQRSSKSKIRHLRK